MSLIITSILFALFIVEFALFIPNASLNISNKINKSKKKDIHIKNIISDLGYQPISGIQNHKIFNKNEVLFDKYYTILDNNYRQTPRINDYPKSKKINFFGGSKTFGWGLNDDETLPYLTQSFFPKTQINNYAYNGYGVHNAYKQIVDYQIYGDLNILITFSNHIPRSACQREFSFGSPRYKIYKNQIIQKGACGNFMNNQFKIIRLFYKVIKKSNIKSYIDKVYFNKLMFVEEDINLYFNLIKELNLYLNSQNKILLIGFIKKNSSLDKRITNFLSNNNIYFVDITLENEEKYTIPIDSHPNKLANITRAKLLSDFIKKKNLLKY